MTASESRLVAIIESSDDAIVSKTLDGIITSWNDGARRIFGWTSEEVVGKSITIIIPRDRLQEEPRILQRIQAGERVDHFETIRQTKDGRLIDVSVTISPVRDERGTIVGVSKVARDITLQKRYQEQLKASAEAADRAREEAERANQAKDHFLSVLSHELRTPLTPALAAVGLLERDQTLPPHVLDSVRMIRRNIETQARIVDDLLDVTRIARGQIQLHFEVVDAHAAIRNVLAMLNGEIESKELTTALSFGAKECQVWADHGRFQHILLNLLSNAVKFTPAGGTISVRTANDAADSIKIEISDTGVGIEPDVLPRLFRPFEQGEQTVTRQFGGIGLGLSIVRSLVEMHRAQLDVSSAGRHKGSTFSLRMAVVSSAAENGPVPKGQPSDHTHHILLVEDHQDTRDMMRMLLASFGCAVTATASVREAVAAAEKETFDLVVSDIGLPDGSGLDVMRHISDRFHISGIALSGFGQEIDVRRSREAGFATHLTKPVNIEVLQDAVERYAQSRS